MISKKIILTGSFGVGKTSLFNRFIHNKFEDKYLTTIGVKVSRKNVQTEVGEVSMLVWDIAGEVAQDKVPNSYFLGTSAIIYVFDLSRPSTYSNISTDIDHLKNLNDLAIIRIVGNKSDLVDEKKLAEVREAIDLPIDLFTSAKTGDNVEDLFGGLATELAS